MRLLMIAALAGIVLAACAKPDMNCNVGRFLSVLGAQSTDEGFLPEYDFDGDGFISMTDYATFRRECGLE